MKLTKIVTSIIFTLFTPFLSHASNESALQKRLEHTNIFSLGMNGFIASQSEGEFLYKSILKNKNPETTFINIISNKNATVESKLYAACGLYTLNHKNIDKLFHNDKEKMASVLKGDILRKEKLSDILSSIEKHGCN